MSNCTEVENFSNCFEVDASEEKFSNCPQDVFGEKFSYYIHVYVIPAISIIGFLGIYHINWIRQ